MPLGIPSHQGLLAPLWRIWPHRFSVLALWVGALVPDVVDGLENIAVRGHFQQWLGHSLLGATAVGIPLGLVLTWLLRRVAARLARMHQGGGLRYRLGCLGIWLCSVDGPVRDRSFPRRVGFEALSVWIGALSHIFFDLLTHETSRLFFPWARDPDWLGSWWTSAWFRVSPPGYPEYPIGPHFVAWILLSLAGVVMFFRWPPRAQVR